MTVVSTALILPGRREQQLGFLQPSTVCVSFWLWLSPGIDNGDPNRNQQEDCNVPSSFHIFKSIMMITALNNIDTIQSSVGKNWSDMVIVRWRLREVKTMSSLRSWLAELNCNTAKNKLYNCRSQGTRLMGIWSQETKISEDIAQKRTKLSLESV